MNTLPQHISYSAFSTYQECGWKYRLTKMEDVPEKHAVWFTGGSAGYGNGIWLLQTGNTTTNGHGNGISVWKNYLFVFRDAEIDTYGPLNGSRAWYTLSTASASYKMNQTAGQNYLHPSIVNSADALLIIGAEHHLARQWPPCGIEL